MHVLLASASVLALVSGEGSRALFSAPAAYAPPATAIASAYGAPLASNVQIVQGTPYYQPAAPAVAVTRSQPASGSVAVYAAAGLLCGALASLAARSRPQPQAVARLDLEPAKIAMLFSSGRNSPAKKGGRPAPKKKPAPKKVAKKAPAKASAGGSPFGFFGGGAASAAKPTGRQSSGRRAGKAVVEEQGEFPPLRFAKNFFNPEKNWLVQAVNLVVNLPEANKFASETKPKDNYTKGG